MRRWLSMLLCLALLAGMPALGQEAAPVQEVQAEATQAADAEEILQPSMDVVSTVSDEAAQETEAPAEDMPEETQAPDVPATEEPQEAEVPEATPEPEAPAQTVLPDAGEAQQPEATVVPEEGSVPDMPATEPAIEATIMPTIEATTEPTIELTIEPTPEPTPTPVPEPLHAELKKTQRSVYANEEAIGLKLEIEGGTAAYSVAYSVVLRSQTVAREEVRYDAPGSHGFSYMAQSAGEYTISAVLTDANGMRAEMSVQIPVAERDPYNGWEYVKKAQEVELTGDWREDLLAVARSQIGYRESKTDFYIDEEGNRRSYTFYGDWYGSRYAGWCGMFVSYCLNVAGIANEDFPYEANAVHWRAIMLERGAYMDDEYEYMPQPGDLVFFNMSPLRNNMPEHMGIVEKVQDGMITVIEGNVESQVKRRKYSLDHRRIIGYVNTSILEAAAESLRGQKAAALY